MARSALPLPSRAPVSGERPCVPVSETAHLYDITTQLAAAPTLETSNRLLLQSHTARLRPASDRRRILQQNSASAVFERCGCGVKFVFVIGAVTSSQEIAVLFEGAAQTPRSSHPHLTPTTPTPRGIHISCTYSLPRPCTAARATLLRRHTSQALSQCLHLSFPLDREAPPTPHSAPSDRRP